MPHADRKIRLDYQRKLRDKRREDGICTRCSGPLDEVGLMDCSECRKKSNVIVKEIIERNLRAGKCQCGQIRIPKKRVCKRCAEHSRRQLKELKATVIEGYGGKCKCCGISTYEFLSVDHVGESGANERRRLGRKLSSGSFYRKIIKENFPARYQLLCYNCNMALGFFGYCPHNPEVKRDIGRYF